MVSDDAPKTCVVAMASTLLFRCHETTSSLAATSKHALLGYNSEVHLSLSLLSLHSPGFAIMETNRGSEEPTHATSLLLSPKELAALQSRTSRMLFPPTAVAKSTNVVEGVVAERNRANDRRFAVSAQTQTPYGSKLSQALQKRKQNAKEAAKAVKTVAMEGDKDDWDVVELANEGAAGNRFHQSIGERRS